MAGPAIKVEILADPTQYKRALGETDRATETTGQKMSGFAKVAVAALAVAAVSAIKQFVGDSIRAFSDLEQAVGGTEAVFGDSSKAIDDFAKGSADAIGLAESEFRTATTGIGGQLKRMTGDVDFAAEHSIILTKTAADLAATYGGTTAEAVTALGAAFRGEADPAERFNLDLKAGKVNAKALEMGLADANGVIDDAARAQAILALITEQSADAQGQFAREADTVAGKAQRAAAETENMKVKIGELMVPVKNLTTDLQLMGLETLGIVALGFQNMLGKITNTEHAIGSFQIKSGQAADSLTAAITINKEYGTSFEDLFATMEFAEGGLVSLTDENEIFLLSIGYTQDEIDALSSLIDRKLVVSQHNAMDAARHHGAAQRELGSGIREVNEEIQTQTDLMRAAADPVFAAMTAIDNLKEAEARLDEVQADTTASASDLAAAELAVADEIINAQGAMDALDPGTLNTAIDTIATVLGKTKDEVILLLQELGVLDGTTANVSIVTNYRETGVGSGSDRRLYGYAQGGVVPGPVGQPQVAVVHGGEEVLTPAQRRSGGSGTVIIHVTALDPNAAAKAVVQAIEIYKRNNGGRLPF